MAAASKDLCSNWSKCAHLDQRVCVLHRHAHCGRHQSRQAPASAQYGETGLYTDRERAALAWTEALALTAEDDV
jgi:alkylhydroperoxidase family enzyme